MNSSGSGGDPRGLKGKRGGIPVSAVGGGTGGGPASGGGFAPYKLMASSFYSNSVVPYLNSFDLKRLFRLHAFSLCVMGVLLTFLPHLVLQTFMNKMDHMTHEVYRLYGVVNISISYIIWKLSNVGDGRVGRLIAETFTICFLFQAAVILRAQLTNPSGHDVWHWLMAIMYLIYGLLYGYIRFVKVIKTFELPGQGHED